MIALHYVMATFGRIWNIDKLKTFDIHIWLKSVLDARKKGASYINKTLSAKIAFKLMLKMICVLRMPQHNLSKKLLLDRLTSSFKLNFDNMPV